MNSYWIIDYFNGEDIEQYGHTYDSYDAAKEHFSEAVHAHNLDDYYNGIIGIAYDGEHLLIIREIKAPC
mgnify:FL=1